MINLKKIKDLDIAKNKFDFLKDIKELLDYSKWARYIDDNPNLFTWFEDTTEGKNILSNINAIPDDFKDSTLSLLNRVRCFAYYNSQKNIYEISLGCSQNHSDKIAISFNRIPNASDLKMLLDMANYLGAYLLNNGNEIIDEKVIERLE